MRGASPRAKLLWLALVAMFTVLKPPLVPEMSVENGTWNLAEFHMHAEAQMAHESEMVEWLMAAGPEGVQDALVAHATESLHHSLSQHGPLVVELGRNASRARARAVAAAQAAQQVWRHTEAAIAAALSGDFFFLSAAPVNVIAAQPWACKVVGAAERPPAQERPAREVPSPASLLLGSRQSA